MIMHSLFVEVGSGFCGIIFSSDFIIKYGKGVRPPLTAMRDATLFDKGLSRHDLHLG